MYKILTLIFSIEYYPHNYVDRKPCVWKVVTSIELQSSTKKQIEKKKDKRKDKKHVYESQCIHSKWK